MKTDHTITIRYTGSDEARRFVLQRGDHTFWTGDGWDARLGRARVFARHKAAQQACTALQSRRYAGKPVRTFTVEVAVTLTADVVEAVPQSALVKYLADAVRIDVENAVYGDGPVDGSFVQARMRLNTLAESDPLT